MFGRNSEKPTGSPADGLHRRERAMQDRRANCRIQASVPCEVRVGEGGPQPGHLLSISVAGAMISARCSPPKDTDVSIELVLPGSEERISLNGFVVRNSESGVGSRRTGYFGIQFNKISRESMLLLKALADSSRQYPGGT
jgi:hypothetical protein